MPAHAAAIEALASRLRGFVRQPDCKLLHVVASSDLRKGAAAAAMATEHAEENRASFVFFGEPHAADDPGWLRRSVSARTQHDARRDGADPPIAELPPPPEARDGLVAFAEQLWQLLERVPAGSEGLVAVLAPTRIESARAWASDLSRIVMGRSLDAARFIVIDVESSSIEPLVSALGTRAAYHEARVPDGAAAAAVATRMAGAEGATPTDVKPPARVDDPPEAELSPEAVLRKKVGEKTLASALAMGSGDAAGAVTAQREARDLCANAGQTDQALQMELVLGGQLMAAGQPKAAEQSFTRALDGAHEAKLPGKVATAGFAVGAVRLAAGQRHTALVAYAQAAVAAEQSGQPMLAIEGNRLAGQAAADIKMEPQAITFFTRAVKLAEAAPPQLVPQTSASLAARGLAKICQKRKLDARGAELLAQAERFEAPPQPEVVPELPSPDATTVESFVPPAPGDARRAPSVAEPDTQTPAGPDLFAVEASIPPPDLLAPPLLSLPSLGPAPGAVQPAPGEPAPAEPAAMLPLQLGDEATPDDFGEGTSLLTLKEIAEMHWGGGTNDPQQARTRPWTPHEIDILQHAVSEALEPEATTLLSYAELAALRGEFVGAGALEHGETSGGPDPSAPPVLASAPPPPALHADPDAPTDDAIAGLEPMARPAPVAPGPSPSPSPSPSPKGSEAFDPDEVTTISMNEVAMLRKAFLDKSRTSNKADDSGDT